ncbi:MAG TPA: hypothetical protein VFH46_07765 [Pyrinomonadaceae bacterium]|jgi:hypothetical protein|nr:hypothetical protein [Pyrinomonadaceae bacterium]
MTTHIEKFFTPSSELTQKLTARMRNESLRDLQGSIQSAGELSPEDSDGKQPWADLFRASGQKPQTPKELAADQRWLSEILYGFLSRLMHSRIQPESESFSAVEAIPAGMGSRLGLDDNDDIILLKQMATEFQQWLAACGGHEFVAGWGTIWLDPADHQRFGLKKFVVGQEDERSKKAASGKSLTATVGSRGASLPKSQLRSNKR